MSEERAGLTREVLVEVTEDAALALAIREGETSVTVSREDVFNALGTCG